MIIGVHFAFLRVSFDIKEGSDSIGRSRAGEGLHRRRNIQRIPKNRLNSDAVFPTYAHNFIFDSIRNYQMGKESWSLPSLTTYKKIRTAAWMQNNLENAVEAFMEKFKCRRKTADRFFREASCLHRRKEPILLDDEEEERDILEELAGEDADDVSQIIWHEVHANAVRTAFDRLTSDEKEYLQRRNALCMKCGCARNIKYGESFDNLGAHFELTTANGAEKAYRKAVDHLTRLLVEDNAICAVTTKRKKVIRRKLPPQFTNIRQTTTASGARLKLILKTAACSGVIPLFVSVKTAIFSSIFVSFICPGSPRMLIPSVSS